jgi:hypothetical protein
MFLFDGVIFQMAQRIHKEIYELLCLSFESKLNY